MWTEKKKNCTQNAGLLLNRVPASTLSRSQERARTHAHTHTQGRAPATCNTHRGKTKTHNVAPVGRPAGRPGHPLPAQCAAIRVGVSVCVVGGWVGEWACLWRPPTPPFLRPPPSRSTEKLMFVVEQAHWYYEVRESWKMNVHTALGVVMALVFQSPSHTPTTGPLPRRRSIPRLPLPQILCPRPRRPLPRNFCVGRRG